MQKFLISSFLSLILLFYFYNKTHTKGKENGSTEKKLNKEKGKNVLLSNIIKNAHTIEICITNISHFSDKIYWAIQIDIALGNNMNTDLAIILNVRNINRMKKIQI